MTWWHTDETHDPHRSSWVESAQGHPEFPIQNLPYGIFAPPNGPVRAGVAIGENILDLGACADAGLLPTASCYACRNTSLNDLLHLPISDRRALRHRLSHILSDPTFEDQLRPMLYEASACRLDLPARIGDYTDFYIGIHHANNVGRQFRPENPLLPNYKYVPIGYHGRASSIRPSGVPVRRPNGQRKPHDQEVPCFGPTTRLDYELELGIWVGRGNELGDPIPINEVNEHIAGFCLLNDWSARDIQAWEYQPLGPFLAKNFHTTISPWIITSEAMAPFRINQPARPQGDPAPLPYLHDEEDQTYGALNLELSVFLQSAKMVELGLPPHQLSDGSASNMYWTVQQIITHHASNGCNLTSGDLMGTGTISAPEETGFGSLMELSFGGTKPLQLPSGEERRFLEDGDEVLFRAVAHANGYASIGFGDCRAIIKPAVVSSC